MSFTVSAGAREDVGTAARFYNSRPGRYGAAFKKEFTRAALAIAANPQMYSLVEDGIPGREIREFLIARFQQRVIYTVRGTDVIVFAVVHASARPGSWYDRLATDIPPEVQHKCPSPTSSPSAAATSPAAGSSATAGSGSARSR